MISRKRRRRRRWLAASRIDMLSKERPGQLIVFDMLAGPDGDVLTEAMFAEDFDGRVLPSDSGAAECYAEIASMRRAAGRPISPFDPQIAAIALSRGADLATRNATDFEMTGLEVINRLHSLDGSVAGRLCTNRQSEAVSGPPTEIARLRALCHLQDVRPGPQEDNLGATSPHVPSRAAGPFVGT